MPYEWVFNGVGGGIAGVFAVLALVAAGAAYRERGLRLKERDDRIVELKQDLKDQIQINKEHTAAEHRLADVIETWTPEQQRETVRRRLAGPSGR